MSKTIKLITLSALFASMIVSLTTFGKIPVGNGYIHTGDSMIYLAACVLPFPYAVFAAAIGGALSDALGGYAIYIIPTLIIKALITLPYTSKSGNILTKRNALMVIPAGLITVAGYFITGLILYGWSGAVVSIIGDIVQAAGSGVIFIAFAAALDKIGFKQNIGVGRKI